MSLPLTKEYQGEEEEAVCQVVNLQLHLWEKKKKGSSINPRLLALPD